MRLASSTLGAVRSARLDDVLDRRLVDAAFALAQNVVAGVDEDAEDPRRERRLAGVGRRRAMDLEERLLDRILGIRDVAEVIPGDALHPIAEAPVDLFKDLRVSRGARGREPAVLGTRAMPRTGLENRWSWPLGACLWGHRRVVWETLESEPGEVEAAGAEC